MRTTDNFDHEPPRKAANESRAANTAARNQTPRQPVRRPPVKVRQLLVHMRLPGDMPAVCALSHMEGRALHADQPLADIGNRCVLDAHHTDTAVQPALWPR